MVSFETRDVCEQVIRQFNNQPISRPGQGGEEHLIQIRYSDTHEQKILKQQTAAGRQFRAQEYEVGVAQARGTMGDSRFLPHTQRPNPNEFETFLQNSAYSLPSVPIVANSTHKAYPNASANGLAFQTWSSASRPQVPSIAVNGAAAAVPTSPTASPTTLQRNDSAGPVSRSGPTTPTKGERVPSKAASEHE